MGEFDELKKLSESDELSMQSFRSFHLPEVDSTNIRLRELLQDEGIKLPVYLRADKQTGGYGRNQRQWASPKGNLYVSFALDAPPTEQAPQLGFVMSLAAYDVLAQFLPAPPLRLKWPNDVLYGTAKIGGLLLENYGSFIIIGIGLNIAKAPKGLNNTATTCLAAHVECAVPSAQDLCEKLVAAFAKRYEFWQSSGFAAILSEWRRRAHNDGEALSVHWLGALQNGTFAGLAEDGSLLLQSDGEVMEISAGDVFLGDAL